MLFNLFEAVPARNDDAGTLYTIRYSDRELKDGVPISEFDLFLEDPDIRDHNKNFKDILGKLGHATANYGFSETWFDWYKLDADPRLQIGRMKFTGQLRLYFLWYGKKIAIVGGGGIKPPGVRRLQDDHDLNDSYTRLWKAGSRIQDRIASREIYFDPETENRFLGNFIFEEDE